ncbi:pentatricopeptide repeat domain-containing [Trichoderma arundinaceum]|uniref:Pentatricopeptide repeat domain-containing n=1 Tax=Trichoderma arundinaceum TaxID=490622 RepID=A0A395NA78_TRIAR|nr:pentatricopeptide repeat domain-containing [Trichoderma arundinaceum]
MQALLSRAGKAPRGGCKACSNAIDTLGKRTTSVRRKPTFAELFTACYSSVFATAALVDAVRKDDRRKDLDRQLEEVRKELADLQDCRLPTSSDGDPESPELSLRQMDTLWQSLKRIYISRPYMKEIHQPATISTSDLIEALKHERYGCLNETLRNSKGQINYDRLESAIMREECEKGKYYREPRNQAQLLRESMSTESLVRKLLDRTSFLPEDQSGPSLQKARNLLEKGGPGFTFRSIDAARAQNNTILLNKRLRSLVAAPNLHMKEKIGRICYNLLVSSHPPDVHTYNTLIVAFNKSGHHSFAEALVASFFQYRLLQPTPSTFIAILNHYKCTNNHGKFLRALACITGLDNRTGAKVRRRHVSDIEENPNLLPWALDSRRRTLTGDWIWEHLPLSQPLVEEIISGLLHFKLFDQAATFFISCMQSGVNLSLDTVRYLLDECINALDWKAAVRLTSSLARSQSILQRLLRAGDGESTPYIASRIRVLLDICGIGGTDQPPSKALLINLKISGPSVAKLLDTLAQALAPRQEALSSNQDTDRSKSRVLQLESIWKEYVSVRKTTLSIESKLLYPDFSPGFRASMALHIGQTATQRGAQLDQELGELTRLMESHALNDPVSRPHFKDDFPRAELSRLDDESGCHHASAETASLQADVQSELGTPILAEDTAQSEKVDMLDYGNTVEPKLTGPRPKQMLMAWSTCLPSEGGVLRRTPLGDERMMRTGG